MPRNPLLKISTLIGRCSIAHVASSWAVIWKQPSPSIATTSSPGLPTWAPMAAGTAKPMVPRPPELIQLRGLANEKCWAACIWCCPTPATTTASPPVSADSRSTTCCGFSGPSDSWV